MNILKPTDVFPSEKWILLYVTNLHLGEGNGTPLQYSCLENPMAEEPGGLQFKGLDSKELDMTEWLSRYKKESLQI